MTDAKLHKLPDLPKVKVKKGKRSYTITDIRYLNSAAVSLLEECIAFCGDNDNVDEFTTFVLGGLDMTVWPIISEILLSVSTSVTVWGGDFSGGTFLVTGTRLIGSTVKLKLDKELAHFIHEYANTVSGDTIDFFDCAMYVADRSLVANRSLLMESGVM